MDLKVINPIGISCSRQIERYQNHENRTSETYLKLIQFYLITLVKVKCQGHFLGYFVFDLKFFHHMREMVGLLWRSRFNLHIHAQWSVVGRPAGCSGMIFFLGKKMFRHDTQDSSFCKHFTIWTSCPDQRKVKYFPKAEK